MIKKIIKAVIGVCLIEGSVGISIFPGEVASMICETLFRGDNHFSWATDLVFSLFYSGGPVTSELSSLIHAANIVAALLVATLLIWAFVVGMVMVLELFGIRFRNRGSA